MIGMPVTSGTITYITGIPETAPLIELGFYLRAAEGRTLGEISDDWSISRGKEDKGCIIWCWEKLIACLDSALQGACLLDVVTANKTYFENRILGIPESYVEDDFAHEVSFWTTGM